MVMDTRANKSHWLHFVGVGDGGATGSFVQILGSILIQFVHSNGDTAFHGGSVRATCLLCYWYVCSVTPYMMFKSCSCNSWEKSSRQRMLKRLCWYPLSPLVQDCSELSSPLAEMSRGMLRVVFCHCVRMGSVHNILGCISSPDAMAARFGDDG